MIFEAKNGRAMRVQCASPHAACPLRFDGRYNVAVCVSWVSVIMETAKRRVGSMSVSSTRTVTLSSQLFGTGFIVEFV